MPGQSGAGQTEQSKIGLTDTYKMRQAVILVGGLGTRLGHLTRDTPKPLLQVGSRPFLEYVIWNLRRFGVTRIVFAAGYLADRIEQHFGDGQDHGVEITYCREPVPLGTGGALRNCLPFLDDQFFVLNGDTLFDINYFALVHALSDASSDTDGVLALRSVSDVERYGSVTLQSSVITGFAEKSHSDAGLINGGVYLLRRSIVDAMEADRKISLEAEIFPKLVEQRRLLGVPLTGYFLDIGLPETLRQAQVDVPAWMIRPIAFLDRDGVINVDTGYTHRPEECTWVKGAPEAIRLLNEAGYLVIVVTNQAGIARGYYPETEFLKFMQWYREALAQNGAHLDDVFYCPYHPTEGIGEFKKDSHDRKPNPGMLESAFQKWSHRKEESFMIGDKPTDVAAARAAGIKAILFDGSDLLETVQQLAHVRDLHFSC